MNEAIEKFLQENSDVLIKILQILEGKSASARFKLDGVQFEIGDAAVELSGEVDLKFVPQKGAEKDSSKEGKQ